MRPYAGHIGSSVSALVDGQLDDEASERAWEHVLTCLPCRRLVEREGWVKTRLASMRTTDTDEPPPHLLGSLYGLDEPSVPGRPSWSELEAWVAADRPRGRRRTRRTAGLVLVGAGSVSAAVLGFVSLSGASLGVGEAPGGTPSTTYTPRETAAVASAAPVTRSGGTGRSGTVGRAVLGETAGTTRSARPGGPLARPAPPVLRLDNPASFTREPGAERVAPRLVGR